MEEYEQSVTGKAHRAPWINKAFGIVFNVLNVQRDFCPRFFTCENKHLK